VRRRRVGILRSLGLARAEIGRVTAWGLAPAAVGSVVVGTAAGLVTALLILPAIDPSRSGGGHHVPLVIDWPLVAVVAGALLASALISGLVASAADQTRRRFGGISR
jgi:ABC-type lipoprotein release transport system permease subunit